MYLVRETMQCKPGKVKEMVGKFKRMSAVMTRLGLKPFRVYTDVAGDPFWTVIADMEVERLDGFGEMEAKMMADEEAGKIMSGYHDLVVGGYRRIFKLET